MAGYVEKNRIKTSKAIEFTIAEHLSILNSDIILPHKKKQVNYQRLLSTVKSRGTVYNNLMNIIDDKHLNPIIKQKSQSKILSGLKKTREELLDKIVMINMRHCVSLDESEEENVENSDDIMESVSNAIKMAKDIVYDIEDKIQFEEDPEEIKKSKIEKEIIPSIAERYVKN